MTKGEKRDNVSHINEQLLPKRNDYNPAILLKEDNKKWFHFLQ